MVYEQLTKADRIEITRSRIRSTEIEHLQFAQNRAMAFANGEATDVFEAEMARRERAKAALVEALAAIEAETT